MKYPIMLNEIKSTLAKYCKPEEKKGLFFSLFDVNGKLIMSQ